MKIKCKYLAILFFICYFFISCVTPKSIIKNGALCGIIVDENNKPISDFVVYCFKGEGIKQSTVTNKSGIFVFQDVDIGKYYIEGEKLNYAKIEKKEYFFNDCSSLFCIQVKSFNECIDNINTYIKVGEFQKGLNLLNSLSLKSGSYSYALSICYSAYLNYMLGHKYTCNINLYKLKRMKNEKCNLFIKYMEDMKNE